MTKCINIILITFFVLPLTITANNEVQDAKENADKEPKQEKYDPFQEGDKFGITSETSGYCLLARFEGRLVIRKLGQEHYYPPAERIEEITPSRTIGGNCSASKTDGAELKIIWAETKGERFTLHLYFNTEIGKNLQFGTDEWQWHIGNASLEYIPADGKNTDPVHATMTSHSQVHAPMTQSFYCKHSLNITLGNYGNGALGNTTAPQATVDVTMQFKAHMQLQPYDVQKSGDFANTYLCQRSRDISLLERLKSNSTIIAGCVLGFVAVAIIIGYTAKRYYLTDRESYTTME